MLATVVVAVLVAAFALVVGVAGWVVSRLWSATGDARDAAPAAAVTAPASSPED
jgi:hypothetical protein